MGDSKVDPKSERVARENFKNEIIRTRGARYAYMSPGESSLILSSEARIIDLMQMLRYGTEPVNNFIGNEMTMLKATLSCTALVNHPTDPNEYIYSLVGTVVFGQYMGSGLPPANMVFSKTVDTASNAIQEREPYIWDQIKVLRKWTFNIGSASCGTRSMKRVVEDTYELEKTYGRVVNDAWVSDRGTFFMAYIADDVGATIAPPFLYYGFEGVFIC